MGQELIIPDVFKNAVPSAVFATLNPQEDSLASGIGQSYAVIGYRGKTWSIRSRGERKNVLDPVNGTPAGYLDVVILGQAKTKSKSYYKDFIPGQEGERPICASLDGITPDADVVQKQSDTCALCPHNEWKTDLKTGRKGRECSDYKRLAVLVLPPQTIPLFGKPLVEPCFLRVPPDSLNSLAIMAETMEHRGFHYSSYVARITFDPNKAHPCMVFNPIQRLSDEEGKVILDLRSQPDVGRITGGDLVLRQAAPPPQAGSVLVAPATKAVTAPVVEAPKEVIAPPAVPASTGLLGGLGVAPGAAGGGPAAVAQAAVAEVKVPQAVVQDSGPAEESDAELDARIAGLIKV